MSLLMCSCVVLLQILKVHSAVPMRGRIMGGYDALPNSNRYIVSLQNNDGRHFCGGCLVHRYWVLTAAHCNIGVQNMMIVAGDYSLDIFEGYEQYALADRLITHPLYNKSSNNADIMLIKLQVPMVLNRPGLKLSLSHLPRQGTGVAEGHLCQVSGWGYSSLNEGQTSFTLQTVTVPIISNARCNGTESYNGIITSNMICAGYMTGGKDACKGDSGGPLVCGGRVYGIVSWGKGCGDVGFPGVYTAVSNFRRWIDQTIYASYGRCT